MKAQTPTFNPRPWPSSSLMQVYTVNGVSLKDQKTNDPSNGGTSPQSYVNISSGTPDTTRPSIYFYFDNVTGTLYIRFRLESNPTTYVGGAPAQDGDPWRSATWTMLIDVNGDGWRDFAVVLDGPSGIPSAPLDVVRTIYSNNTTTQSIDFTTTPGVYQLAVQYAARAYTSGAATGQIEQFDGNGNLITNNPWGTPSNTLDFGTSRIIDSTATGGDYFLDFQMPISTLDARAYGGPQLNSQSLMTVSFCTANSLNDPLQKDFGWPFPYTSCTTCLLPGGDMIYPGGNTTIVGPVTKSITATPCPNITLTASVLDQTTIVNNTVVSVVDTVKFYYWYDTNGNDSADVGEGSWTLIGNGTSSSLGVWTVPWNTSSLLQGQYLIKTVVHDQNGYTRDSYLQTSATSGGYVRIHGIVSNPCGIALANLSKTVTPVTITSTASNALREVTYTLTVTNPATQAITLSSITDQLPTGFKFDSVAAGGTLGTPTSVPSLGASGSVVFGYSPSVSIPANSSRTLKIKVLGGTSAGTFSNTITATGNTIFTSAVNVAPVLVTDASASLTKIASTNAPLNPGQAITYTISYQNNGSVALTNVVIRDTLKAGLKFGSANSSGTYNSGTRVVSWTIGSLAIGQAGSVSVTDSVNSPYDGASPLTNYAVLAATEFGSGTVNSNTVSNTVLAPILSFQKDVSPVNASPGNIVTYTLTYGNTGTANATNPTIKDTLPANVTYLYGTSSIAVSRDSLSIPGRDILTFTGFGPIFSGSINNTITFQAQVVSPYPTSGDNQSLVNTAYISSDQNGKYPAVNTLLISANPYVSMVKTSNQNAYAGTDSAQYTITLTNNGSTSARVDSITDVMPTSLFKYGSTSGGTLTPATTPTSGSTGTLKWTFTGSNALIAAGVTKTLIFKAKVDTAQGTYTNRAFTYGLVYGPTNTVDSARCIFSVVALGSETFQKSADKPSPFPGDTVTYTLFYKNATGQNQSNRSLFDTLNTSLVFVSQKVDSTHSTILNPGFTVTGQALTWGSFGVNAGPAGNKISGDSLTIILKATISPSAPAGTSIPNNLWLKKGGTGQSVTSNTITINVIQPPKFSFAKTVDRSTASAGTRLNYTLSYNDSTGAGAATNVVITDTIPSHVTYVSGSATGGGVYSSTPIPRVIWNLGTITGGISGSVGFAVTVNSGVVSGTIDTNKATLTNAENKNKSARASTTFLGLPNFTLTKAVDKTLAGPGDTLSYTVNYTNSGTDSATNVFIVDRFDTTKVTFVSATGTFSQAADSIRWTIGKVLINGNGTVTFKVRVKIPVAQFAFTQVTNSATIKCTQIPNINSNTVGTTINYPLLSINKTVDSSAIRPGNIMRYTLLVSNGSLISAPNVVIYDSIPSNCSYVLGSTRLNGVVQTDTLSTSKLVYGISLGTVTSTVTDTITFQVQVASPLANSTRITNGTARLTTSKLTDTFRANSVTTIVQSVPVLSLSKSASVSGTSVPGDTITYTLTYGNTGTTSAYSVVLADTIPSNTSYVVGSVTGTSASYSPTTNSIVISRDSITAGTSNQVATFKVVVNSPLPNGTNVISNTGRLSASNAAGVSATATSNITASSTLELSKSAPAKKVLTGSPTPTASWAYTVNYSVTGTANTDSVFVNDVIPTNVTYDSSKINGVTGGTYNSGTRTVTFNIGTANPVTDGSVTIYVHSTVKNTYVNTAKITSRANPTGVTSSTTTLVSGTFTGTLTQTPSTIYPTQQLTVTVNDSDLIGQGIIFVNSVNVRTGEVEAIGLSETGSRTGIFTGTIFTIYGASAGTNNNGFLTCQANDTIRTTYNDAVTAAGGTASVIRNSTVYGGNTGIVYSIPTTTAAGNTVIFAIKDRDLDRDTTKIDTVRYTVTNLATGETEYLTFIETGVKSDSFTVAVPTVYDTTTGANNTGSFNVQPGQVLRLSYFDSLTTQGGTATVTASCTIGTVNFSTSRKTVLDINGGSVVPGDSLLYVITVKNTGSVAATSVSVVDTLPTGVVVKKIYGSGVQSGRIITWSAVSSIAVGDSVKDSVKVYVDSTVANGVTKYNIARISGNGTTVLDSAAFSPVNLAALFLRKSVDKATGAPADTLTYTLRYGNIGTDSARTVNVLDTIPANVTYVTGSVTGTGASYNASGNRIIVTRSAIAQGDTSNIVTFKVRVNTPLPVGTNTVTNKAYESASNATTIRDTVNATITATVNFGTSTKSYTDLNGGQQVSGDSILYTIKTRNTGNQAAVNVVVTDTLPSNVKVKSGSISNSGTQSGQVITWPSVASLASGDSLTYTVTVVIDSLVTNGGTVTNKARIVSTGAGPQIVTTSFTATNIATLFLRKSVDKSSGNPGDTLTYTLKYGDIGTDSARTVQLLDTIPANTTYLSGSITGTGSSYDSPNNRIVVNRALIAQGDTSSVVTFKAIVSASLPTGTTLITNKATETAGNAASRRDSVTTSIFAGVSFATSTKSFTDLNGGQVVSGDTVLYTITVKNSGNTLATNVAVTDSVPARVKVVSGSISNSGIQSGSLIAWSVASLAVGGTQPLTFKAVVDSLMANGDTVTNSAKIRATTDSVVVRAKFPVLNVSTLFLRKTVDKATGIPGDTLMYTLRYGNLGTDSARTVSVLDTIAGNTTYVTGSVTGTGASYDAGNNRIVVNRALISQGDTANIVTFRVRVNSPLPSGNTTIRNRATESASNGTAVRDSVSSVITATSVVTLAKSAPATALLLGSPTPTASLTYTLRYTVTGNATVDSVYINDSLRAGLNYVSSTNGGAFAGGIVKWNLGSKNPGTIDSVRVTVSTTVAATYSNSALITRRGDTTGVPSDTVTTRVYLPHTALLTQNSPIFPGQTVTFTVNDTDMAGRGPLAMSAVNIRTGESESITLTETGVNTGVFTATRTTVFGLVSNGNNNGSFAVIAGDTLRGTFVDAVNASGTVDTLHANTVVRGGYTATLAVAPTVIAANNNFTWTLHDSDLNHNASVVESYSLIARSNTGETETLVFTETGANTGIFAAVLRTLYGSTPGTNNDSVMTVMPNDSITVSYFDSLTAIGDTASIAATGKIGIVDLSTSVKTVTDLSGGLVLPNDTLLYRIISRNTGTVTATSVTVIDTLPTQIALITGSMSRAGSVSGRVISFSTFTLAPGASDTTSYQVIIDSTIADGVSKLNIAHIRANGIDQLDTVSFTPSNRPAMTLVKAVDRANAKPGDTLTYTVTYSNAGTGTADSVTITDTTPLFTRYIHDTIRLNTAAKTDSADADEVGVIYDTPTPGRASITIRIGKVASTYGGKFTFKVVVQ